MNLLVASTQTQNQVVEGDFDLGYMDWNVPSVITGKANLQQHKLFLDIINDHCLLSDTTCKYSH